MNRKLTVFYLLCCLLLLASCGQTGRLYLPEDPKVQADTHDAHAPPDPTQASEVKPYDTI